MQVFNCGAFFFGMPPNFFPSENTPSKRMLKYAMKCNLNKLICKYKKYIYDNNNDNNNPLQFVCGFTSFI